MKKVILIILTLGHITSSFSQLAVSDPANTAINKASLLKTSAVLAKATKTLDETRKSVKILEDAKKAVEKVSTIIRDLNTIQNVIDMQSKLVNKATNQINNIKSSDVFSSQEITNMSGTFINIITSSNKGLELIKKLLKDDVFKMEDSDRLTFLRDIEQEIKSSYLDVLFFSKKYNAIMNKRIIKKLAKK